MNSVMLKSEDRCGQAAGAGAFRLSKKVDYALVLLDDLAKFSLSQPYSLRDISLRHHLSFYFFQNVARLLRAANIITAVRGKTGGYVLTKDISEITLKELIEAVDGPITVMDCVYEKGEITCANRAECLVRPGIMKLNAELETYVLSKNLSYFLDR